MTSRGYDSRQSPGLGYKRVVSCKDSFHGTDVLAVSEHGAPGRRPNRHAHFVGRQREDGLDTLPARAAEANRSTLIADIPFPAPENVAAKRCASEKRTREGHAAPHPEGFDPTLESPPRPPRCGKFRASIEGFTPIDALWPRVYATGTAASRPETWMRERV